jgi:hypothetical protein
MQVAELRDTRDYDVGTELGRLPAMDQETAKQLIESLDSRFVSYKVFSISIIIALVGAIGIPIGVTVFVVGQTDTRIEDHANLPTHEGAVSQREFRFIDQRLNRIESNQSRFESKLDVFINGN